ncbi:hypothetical protein [Shewanella sp.]|uniref:hypothetical protein n=1 Tax=Shewanella sp. TaxID=50422 RepID=UPI004048C456
MATPQNDKIPDENADDSAADERSPRGSQIEDPLEAIKAMRLGQLSVCSLKTEQEMQAMVSNLSSG